MLLYRIKVPAFGVIYPANNKIMQLNNTKKIINLLLLILFSLQKEISIAENSTQYKIISAENILQNTFLNSPGYGDKKECRKAFGAADIKLLKLTVSVSMVSYCVAA